MNKNFGLAELVAPLTVEQFKADFNQFYPLYLPRQDPEYFSELLSKDDLHRFFQRNDFRYPGLSLFKNGSPVDRSEYTYQIYVSGQTSEIIDVRKLFAQFDQGATILLGALEMSLDSIREFCHGIYSEMQSNASVTGFYTPVSSQGFHPHFDDVDVFVLQLFGTKTWRVYGSPYPYATHTADCDVTGIEVLMEVELNPGDTLYIPRGFVHDARATDHPSFHISLSLAPYTWLDLFNFVIQDCKELVGFRAPIDINSLDENQIEYRIRGLIDQMLARVPLADIQQHFHGKVDRHLDLTNNDYLSSAMDKLK